jgi:hypothetical protein
VNTKTWPFESTATPETSPKFNPAGSFRNSGTDWNGSVGTVSWPNDHRAHERTQHEDSRCHFEASH